MATQKPMGIGIIGSNNVTFKRKFRWTFSIQGFCNNAKNTIPENFVKVAARPGLDIEEVEVNFLNAKMWLPGKGTWNTITVTYYDAAYTELQNLYNWLATVYNFADPVNLTQGEKRDWNGTGVLNMYDGCGTLLETWQLLNVFPKAVEFGDLSYEDSAIAEIELTLRYSNVKYQSYCPAFVPQSCCTPCNGGISVGQLVPSFS